MREFADADAIGANGSGFVLASGKRRDRVKTSRREGHAKGIMIASADRLIDGRIVIGKSTVKSRFAIGRIERHPIECAKSVIIEIVIVHHHEIAIAQLSHEMEGLSAVECANER